MPYVLLFPFNNIDNSQMILSGVGHLCNSFKVITQLQSCRWNTYCDNEAWLRIMLHVMYRVVFISMAIKIMHPYLNQISHQSADSAFLSNHNMATLCSSPQSVKLQNHIFSYGHPHLFGMGNRQKSTKPQYPNYSLSFANIKNMI